MARTGFGASNFLRSTSPPATAFPFSMSLWFRVTAGAANLALGGLFNSASNGVLNMFVLQATTGRALTFTAADGAGNTVATTSTTWSDATWAHALIVAASATVRSVYLNGGGKGSSAATSRIPSGINRWSLGLRDNASAAKGELAAGDMMAENAFWSIALADDDARALAVGVPAYLVRPDSLVAYAPIIDQTSPEINLCSNTATLAIQGTLSAGAHPRIYRS